MEHWSEIRTAYAVMRLGTVSAAARALGIHRATVIRHIDALEEGIGTRLFLRHPRGYTPTEAGRSLEQLARVTDEKIARFVDRVRNEEAAVIGEVIVTSVDAVAPLVARGLALFREKHPETTVRYIATGRILQLEYGQAHVAVRAGARPTEPDHVVRPFRSMQFTFYAHTRYVERHGLPATEDELVDHVFVSHEDPSRMPFFSWLESVVPARNIVLRSSSQRVLLESMLAGVGIGFMPTFQAATLGDLHPVMPPRPDWVMPLWLVTHTDLHRTAKVKALSGALLAAAQQA